MFILMLSHFLYSILNVVIKIVLGVATVQLSGSSSGICCQAKVSTGAHNSFYARRIARINRPEGREEK